ncbi:hypothetical protein SEA_BIG4_357 [Microbacterium phage Big4]|nr:hypothetical protein SEA_BIG4_31 [Microbacterium phage Big4]URP22390.1 hypothetical protein SEA_BIG4_357 [Microbacterium phage Big4]
MYTGINREKEDTMTIQIRAIADGKLLDILEGVPEGDEYEELSAMTGDMRRTYPGRENIVVQLIRGEDVEAENFVNPAPALS